eukprot:CAMPEP_0172403928 /NCGR_PEP_ID=MMETSP1061-20121228/61182_1 /TAXON_ID=37318 /ORGANISM="Pseudo-nitzschia pungens, Strain cf. pungens" /LENGTH=176 /DNA_ID=CAMNT_0013138511 /DNA_START=45 /DNA_END=576 /DNA_ORIENTATION=+
MENLSGFLIPIGTIVLIVLVQISFWFPTDTKQQMFDEQATDDGESTVTAEPPVTSSSEDVPILKGMTKDKSRSRIRNVVRITPQTIVPDNLQCIFITDDKNGNGSFSNSQSSKNNDLSKANGVESNKTTAEKKATVWKCTCELGFLSSGVFKTFGNAEAIMDWAWVSATTSNPDED